MAAARESTALLSNLPRDESVTLYLLLPLWARVAVPALLLFSLVCNVVALVPSTPFLNLTIDPTVQLGALGELHPKVPGFDNGEYGMTRTLALLKYHKLWGLYMVILILSVIWPPLKLLIATILLGVPLRPVALQWTLAIIGQLGRTSLIDIYFVVIVVLVMAQQDHGNSVLHLHLEATVQWGVIMFHVAVLSSIAAVAILEDVFSRRMAPHEASLLMGAKGEDTEGVAAKGDALGTPAAMTADEPRGARRVIGGLAALAALVLSMLSFCLTLFQVRNVPKAEQLVRDAEQKLPGMQLSTDLLEHRSWGLSKGVSEELLQSHNGIEVLFGLDLLLFTLLTPIFCTMAMLTVYNLPRGSALRAPLRRAIRIVSQFSNLEIVLLAMIVYLSQEQNLVVIWVKQGYWCLVAYVCVLLTATVCDWPSLWRYALHREA